MIRNAPDAVGINPQIAMPRVYDAPTRAAIIAAIMEHGPLSAADLSARLNMDRKTIDSSIRFARKPGNKILYICKYRRNIGIRGRHAPIYDLGNLPDVQAPSRDRKATMQRYRAKFTDEEWKAKIDAQRVRRRELASPDSMKQQYKAWRDAQRERKQAARNRKAAMVGFWIGQLSKDKTA